MKKRICVLLGISFIVSYLISCESRKVEPDPNHLGYDYFPLETGQYAIFDVYETYYSLTANPIIRIYQVKEEVAESFTDLSGETAYKLLRYSRKDTLSNWQMDSVWVARRTLNQAVHSENNVPFVKLVFPLEEKQAWNGNALNNLGKEEYIMQSINMPYTLPGHHFENTVTVSHKSDSSIVGLDKRLEVYAQGVGMIYKETAILQYCQSTVDCRGKGIIDFGVKFYHRLHSYGKN